MTNSIEDLSVENPKEDKIPGKFDQRIEGKVEKEPFKGGAEGFNNTIMKLLTKCQKCDWDGVEEILNYFEKSDLTGESKFPLSGVTDEISGWTPLMYAVQNDKIHHAVKMLTLGCDINATSKNGKTSLHLAAQQGHTRMCEVLLGQGAQIDAQDNEQWTPLHYAAKTGEVNTIRLLNENNANPLNKNSQGHSAIWLAAAEYHIQPLTDLLQCDHDFYDLLEDNEFIFNLTICGRHNENAPISNFILSSHAPLEFATKLSTYLEILSKKEIECERDLMAASKHSEAMASDLLALASRVQRPGNVLQSIDRNNMAFLDILIENERKELIANTVVQRHLEEIWLGSLKYWANWKLCGLFLSILFCPPIWIFLSLPIGHKFFKIPIIKFMTHLTSHLYLIILICITSITPIEMILPIRMNLFPYWNEWLLVIWIIGLLWLEIRDPSDKLGLGWIQKTMLTFSLMAFGVHLLTFVLGDRDLYGALLYLRNQLFGYSLLLACVKLIDFLYFHRKFGPLVYIFGKLLGDLARFLGLLGIFLVGFSMVVAALNLPLYERTGKEYEIEETKRKILTNGLPSGALVTPLDSFELLYFALFGLQSIEDIRLEPAQPPWTLIHFKIFFWIFLIISVVLWNLLFAMMLDTYQRIRSQSDLEWKFGLATRIRNLERNNGTCNPINLFTDWIVWIFNKCHPKKVSDLTTATPNGLSQMTLGNPQKIENVVDWPLIVKKYRTLFGKEELVQP